MPRLLLVWLAAVNVVAFAAMGLDKAAAIRRRRRVPEATLHALAAAGGFVGTWLGSRAFRHKTIKQSFRWRHALFSAVGIALVAALTWAVTAD